jgi:hypothetical protein
MAHRDWGFSSAGRAPALQAGCQRFESANLHGFRKEHVGSGSDLVKGGMIPASFDSLVLLLRQKAKLNKKEFQRCWAQQWVQQNLDNCIGESGNKHLTEMFQQVVISHANG